LDSGAVEELVREKTREGRKGIGELVEKGVPGTAVGEQLRESEMGESPFVTLSYQGVTVGTVDGGQSLEPSQLPPLFKHHGKKPDDCGPVRDPVDPNLILGSKTLVPQSEIVEGKQWTLTRIPVAYFVPFIPNGVKLVDAVYNALAGQ
jgi:hypothetical protein